MEKVQEKQRDISRNCIDSGQVGHCLKAERLFIKWICKHANFRISRWDVIWIGQKIYSHQVQHLKISQKIKRKIRNKELLKIK